MYAQLNPALHESLYDAIGRWTASAPTHLLHVLLWSGLAGALGVMVIDPVQWYLGVGMVAMAALGSWGLLEHRRAGDGSREVQTLEWVAATVTVVAALVAIIVGLFVFMGPAPHF